ncbi:MAG: hypothetical protein ACYSUK_00135 [Planctomycetota bacterium]|jgi:DNA-directed RNA polymerase specialized sigma subunit
MPSVGPVLQDYFRQTGKTKRVEQTDEFCKQWKLAVNNVDVRNDLIASCMPLAVSMARNYHKRLKHLSLLLDDVVQQALFVLSSNIMKWPYKQVNFIAWIINKIRNGLWAWTYTQQLVYIPKDVWYKLRRAERESFTLQDEIDIFNGVKEEGDIHASKIVSLARTFSKHDNMAIDFWHDYRLPLDNDLTYCLCDVERLLPLCVTNAKTREIFSRRYGLTPYKKIHKIKEIEKLFGITHQSIYYHILKAVQLMRDYVYPPEVEMSVCEFCDGEFPKSPKGKKYCSTLCRQRHWEANHVGRKKSS